MEFANQCSNPLNRELDEISEVRVAKKSDAMAITRLLNSTRFTHYHVDWHMPVDWLGDAGFVVIPRAEAVLEAHRPSLFLPQDELLACLAVTAEPMPAAWVRLAAVSDALDSQKALADMFAVVKANLRATAVTEVGWLVLEPWLLTILPDLGFEEFTVMETYMKGDLNLPEIKPVPDLLIRPVAPEDFEKLAALETAVFEPLWRFSKETLRLARRDAVSFDVAYLGDRLVGYQISSGGRFGAHLVRLTISPDLQGQGIGTAIFAHTIEEYQRRGYQHITLNTQVDNDASHRLYKKFGFSATGEQMPMWVMSVSES
ncbi:MAG: GNAT family N-acetyltransferase [Anaerolineae bacterium]|nr:GNAT family N-acetyltransferase [Anaerolineae bacterium]